MALVTIPKATATLSAAKIRSTRPDSAATRLARESVLRVLTQGDQPDFSDAESLDLGVETMSAPVGILTVDLDGDGELDIVSINRESGTITAFYGGQ